MMFSLVRCRPVTPYFVTDVHVARPNYAYFNRTASGQSLKSDHVGHDWRQDLQTAAEWGGAHGILVQETPGDITMVTQALVEAEERFLKLYVNG